MKTLLLVATLLAVALAIPSTADAGLVFRNGPFDGHRLERVKQGVGKVVKAPFKAVKHVVGRRG